MDRIPTADLCDANEASLADGSLRVVPPVFIDYSAVEAFSGPVATVRCFEDNGLVRAALEEAGKGRVLVVDGGGSTRCALVGGNLGQLAQDNGWAGVIVHGCVRDTPELRQCKAGIRALASNPMRGAKRGGGEREVPVEIAGVRVAPGHWCYADADGILIADRALG